LDIDAIKIGHREEDDMRRKAKGETFSSRYLYHVRCTHYAYEKGI